MNIDSKQKFLEQRCFFPPLKTWAFFDHGTGGLFPTYSNDVMIEYLNHGQNYGMTFEEFAGYWDFTDRAREDAAAMFNCNAEDIMYGASSTWLFNIFINGLDLKPGDNVITSSASHESVPFILLNKRQDGVEVRFVDPVDGATNPEDVFRLVDNRTRAICLNHVEKVYGFRHDLKTYGDFCREHKINFGVDASHSAGAMKIDVNEMGIDFLTCSGYKWMLSPLGIGMAYISPRLQKELKLIDTGWSSDKERWNKDVKHPNTRTDARRFECGGISIVALKGFTEVARMYNKLGAKDIQDYILSLADEFCDRAKRELKAIHVYGNIPKENRSNIIAVYVPEEFGMSEELMYTNGIRAHCFKNGTVIRVGFHYMNDSVDIDCMISFLKSIEKKY